jgi:uncharacterized protein
MSSMRLRPHHLLCLQGFRGHGYDPAFTANLAVLARAAVADPGGPVTLVEGLDDVCAACPHAQHGVCVAPEGGEASVGEHDALVLAALGLRAGDVPSFADVRRRLAASTDARSAVQAPCRSCRWLSVCGRPATIEPALPRVKSP